MGIFNKGFDEEAYLDGDEGSMAFSGADAREERERKLNRAKEIVSGLTSGMFESDDEVFELARKIKGED